MMRTVDHHQLQAEPLTTQQNIYSLAAHKTAVSDPAELNDIPAADAIQQTNQDPFAGAPVRKYPAGTVLLEQGAPIHDVYKLEQGLAKTIARDAEGREVIIGLCSTPGAYLGAACAISDLTLVSAELVTDAQLRRISADTFCQALQHDAALSWAFHQTQSKLLWRFVNKLVQFGCHSVQERLEQLLWQLVQVVQPDVTDGKPVRITMPLKYWEIAELIAVSPEHLCRVIRSMESQGTLRRDKGRLVVLEPEKLSRTESALW